MNPSSQRDAATNELPPMSPGISGAGDTWWSRNWVRVLVVGSCGAVVLFFAGIVFIVVGAFGMMRSSGACQEAVARAAATPAVVQALGSPIAIGWFVTGTLDPGRHAEMKIPISGPRGSARIDVVASKEDGTWNFSTLTVRLRATGARISLVEQRRPAASSP
jgi:Cytochrome oxidase complex assembly protein 1